MKPIKRISLKILILVLITGIVGIVGMLIMKYNVSGMARNYEVIVEDNVDNSLHMTKISSMMYRHQTLVARHVLVRGQEEMSAIEKEEAQLSESIKEELAQMKEKMTEGKHEQLYHQVYSGAIGYFKNVDNVFKLSREGSTATAEYYINSVMTAFIEDINKSVDDMESLTNEEMEKAKAQMEKAIFYSNVSEVVCIICIAVTVAVSLFLCATITSKLEKYKNYLEKQVERQTSQLLEHSKKMLEIQDNTIIGMANLIENRDGDTGEHIKRTSRYVEMLAKKAQEAGYCSDILTDDYIELLVKAAPMHDIGKIAVPDSILKKPGKITPEEYERMKEHAAAGGKIVCEVLGNIEDQKYIDIAAQVAEGHHEKWNGEGYPHGLKGDKIPLCARIMAIADVFDALVSKRCYKEAMSPQQAFEIIEQSSGSHFDPVLAKMFLGMRKEIENMLAEDN